MLLAIPLACLAAAGWSSTTSARPRGRSSESTGGPGQQPHRKSVVFPQIASSINSRDIGRASSLGINQDAATPKFRMPAGNIFAAYAGLGTAARQEDAARCCCGKDQSIRQVKARADKAGARSG